MSISNVQPQESQKYKNPTVVAYKSIDELRILKEWFYNFQVKDNRVRAIQRVRALSSRARLPHGIEATSYLTSIRLDDLSSKQDINVLQLSYTMALIRFVNGLLDPFQQSSYAIPLHQLAKNLNLPSFFVELRHMGTHESLPSMPMLRIAATRALNWLYDNYWSHIEEDEVSDDDGIEDLNVGFSLEQQFIQSVVSQITYKFSNTQLANNMKTYKKIRKASLDVVFKPGDNSNETAIKYWKAMNGISKLLDSSTPLVEGGHGFSPMTGSQLLINMLVYKNCLIYNADKISNKLKFNPLLIKLYRPLLDHLGLDFQINLFLGIVEAARKFQSPPPPSIPSEIEAKAGFAVTHPFEENQLLEWLSFLLSNVISNEGKNTTFKFKGNMVAHDRVISELLDVFDQVRKSNNDQDPALFIKIFNNWNKSIENSDLPEEIIQKSQLLNKTASTSIQMEKFELPPSLDDLLTKASTKREPTLEYPGQKRTKIGTFLFEAHPIWKPTPFGTPI
jgi:ribosomal biogenesis protein LAS1